MTAGHLLVERRDGRLDVVLNRPDKRNALSRALLADIRRTFDELAGDDTLRVAVLRGAGDKSFAAGGDLKDLEAVRTLPEAEEMAFEARAALEAVRRFPVPVVAALNGDALGGGAELASACDFRIGAAHARIGFIQGRLNIATAWGGGVDLMHIVGPTTALRLMSRSDILDMAAARDVRLVDVVAGDDGLDAAVDGFVAPILNQAPQVVRAFKALTNAHRAGAPRAELYALETERFARTWVHDDHWEAAARALPGKK
ncbi:enoyl-CoA hydratase/isomerase family protein [Azospirillum sp.]|uniref:enoyl-CoA hydratase/isomerase family protein n=1 Tax=Azospirillum sp. TaxID=34012 RepID=UPI002D30FB26|nr:enoyl-CoA hydratase/isomerase family protein [Azospirillum sp.]HYD66310.1 enoyl-CoA hydratase/isomerase family protein [Azospirillum sp.]